jgi:hypothetical protein
VGVAVSEEESIAGAVSEVAAEAIQPTRQSAGPQVYVVQLRTAGEATSADGEPATGFGSGALWMDLAVVTVPARSKRRTIIAAALATERGAELTLPVTLRILDADAAREFPVGLRPRDPELVIG